LLDGIGDDAVDSGQGEQERGHREDADEREAEAALLERRGVYLRQSVKARRDVRVEITENGPRGGVYSIRRARSQHDHRERPGGGLRTLPPVDVDSGARPGFEAVVADVSHDSNDGE